MRPYTLVLLLALVSVLAFPLAAAAQEEGGGGAARPGAPVAGKPQSDAQKMGEAIFTKNCHLCHISSGQKEELKIVAPTLLIGLFKDSAVTEDAVRQMIQTGIPRRMPSFKYNFTSAEMNDLIAYLKIR